MSDIFFLLLFFWLFWGTPDNYDKIMNVLNKSQTTIEKE